MKLESKIIGVLIILSTLTPYVYTVLFLRSTSLFQSVLVYFFALITLIITVIWLIRLEGRKKMKLFVGTGALISVVLFIFSYKILVHTSDRVFFKLREKRLIKFSKEINQYGKINFLMDTQKGLEYINDYQVEHNEENVFRNTKTGKRYLLNGMIEKENIDLEHYRAFSQTLNDLDLWSFDLKKDGTIFFRINREVALIFCQNGDELQHDLRTNKFRKINYTWEELETNWYIDYQ